MINNGRTSFLSAPDLDGMLEGGVPILVEGHVIGAVGVSGVKSTEDAQIAKARYRDGSRSSLKKLFHARRQACGAIAFRSGQLRLAGGARPVLRC
jgi:hypothetical protein